MSVFGLHEFTYLKFLLGIFSVFGLTTASVVINKTGNPHANKREVHFVGSRIAIFYNVIFILIVVSMNYLTVGLLYTTRYKQTLSLFHVIDFFEILFGTFITVLILISNCIHQKEATELITKIYKVKLVTDEQNMGRKGKSTFFCVASLIVFHVFMSTSVLISGIAYYNNIVLLFSSTSRNCVITWLVLQYAIVVRILDHIFENINDALLNLVKLPQFEVHSQKSINSSVLVSTGKLQLLSSVRDLHYSVLDICQTVIKFYDLIILGCIAYIFVCLVVFTYFLVDLVIERKVIFSVIEYIHLFLWLACFISAFVILSRYVSQIMNQIEKTGIIVHQLIRSTLNKQILKELKDFSLYLLHVRIKFTALGFFALDGSLVNSIFGSITTYLVILIQFQLDSTSRSETCNNTLSK